MEIITNINIGSQILEETNHNSSTHPSSPRSSSSSSLKSQGSTPSVKHSLIPTWVVFISIELKEIEDVFKEENCTKAKDDEINVMIKKNKLDLLDVPRYDDVVEPKTITKI